MANQKISKVAKDLNIGISNIRDTLEKKGFTVDAGPNARISEEQYEILLQVYAPDRKQNEKNADFLAKRQREKQEKKAAKEETKQPPVTAPTLRGLKVVGSLTPPTQPEKKEETPEKPAETASAEYSTSKKRT